MGRLMFLDSGRTIHLGVFAGLCGTTDRAGAWDPVVGAPSGVCEECLTRDGNYHWPDGRKHTVDELE